MGGPGRWSSARPCWTVASIAGAPNTSSVGDHLSAGRWATYERVLDRYTTLLAERLAQCQALTLVYDDAHAESFLLPHQPAQQPVYLNGWHHWAPGVGPWDVACWLTSAWPSERRAGIEQALVRDYHARLLAYGGLAYDWASCWRDYRLGVVRAMLVPLRAWVEGAWTADWGGHRLQQLERAFCAFEELACAKLLTAG